MIRISCKVVFLLTLVQSYIYASELHRPDRTGWMQIHLSELPAPESTARHVAYQFDPKSEVFEMYIPSDYDPKTRYGVLAWINPIDIPNIPRRFESLFEEFDLIAISADRIGNEQDPARRIGLMECAISQISKSLNVDSQKRFVSGWSGGGRTSAMACFLHPQFWSGAISWVGGNFYKSYSRPMPVGTSSPGINDWYPGAVTDDLVKLSKENCRFVLITGSKDFNLMDSRGIYRAFKNEKFQAKLIEEPGLDHNVGSADSMRLGMKFPIESKS